MISTNPLSPAASGAGSPAPAPIAGPCASSLRRLLPFVLLLPGVLALVLVQGTTEGLRQLVLAGTLWLLTLAALVRELRTPSRLVINRQDLLLCVFVASIALSWVGANVSYASAESLVQWLQGLVLYFLLVVIHGNRRDGPGTALLLLVLPVALVIREALFAAGLGWSWATWPLDPFSWDPNTTATLVVPGLLLSIHYAMAGCVGWRRVVFAALALACALLVYRSDSRAVWLGLVLAVALAALTWSRDGRTTVASRMTGWPLSPSRVALVLAAAMMLAMVTLLATLPLWFDLVADHVGESVGGRLRRWANGIMIAWERLPLGAGAGNWLDVFPGYRGTVAADPGGSLLPFNTVLELIAEGGVVMMVPFAVLVTAALVGGSFHGRALALKAALFCLLVTSYFHISFTINAVVMTWVIVLFMLSPSSAVGRPAAGVSSRVVTLLCLAAATANLGYKSLATHASMRAAVLKSHLEYIGNEPAFAFPRRAQYLPAQLMDYLQDVDYRHETPATFYEGRFATYIFRDVYAYVGTRQLRRGRCDAAQTWFDAALERNPAQGGAIVGQCRCAATQGKWALAAAYCAEAVEHSPFDAGARIELAAAQANTGDGPAALEQLNEADRLARSRIGDHEFGLGSARRVSHFLLQRREIKVQRASVHERLGAKAATGEVLEAIADLPEIHKSMAWLRGRLYFSSNEGGDYDLWELRVDTGRAGMISHDSLAAFRLSAHSVPRELFFVADHQGDYRYALYAFDPVNHARRRIAPLSNGASVAEYALSPDGRSLVYKAESGRGHRLVLHDIATGAEVELPRDPGTPRRGARYTQPVWSPDARFVAFVSDRNRVLVYDVDDGDLGVFAFEHRVTDLAYAVGDATLMVLESTPDESSRLTSLSPTDGARRPIDTAGRRVVSVTPVEAGRVLVHVFDRDRYLLHLLDTATGVYRAAGPEDGVAYAVTVDGASRRAYYLHSDPDTPLRVVELALDTLAWRELYRPTPPLMAPPATIERRTLGAGGVPYYVVEPDAVESPPVIVWLHGSTSSFSPRWHKYAQYLAASGIVFAALNFSGSQGQPRADLSGEALEALQVEEVRAMVDAIRTDPRFADSVVVALGVSFGTLLAERVVSHHPGLFDGVIEFAPLRAPRGLATGLPYLSFAGENDAYANLADLRAGYAGAASNQSLVVFPGEGHDLRDAVRVAERLSGTIDFVNRLSGRRGAGDPAARSSAPQGR